MKRVAKKKPKTKIAKVKVPSRKEQRKQKRTQKKENRVNYQKIKHEKPAKKTSSGKSKTTGPVKKTNPNEIQFAESDEEIPSDFPSDDENEMPVIPKPAKAEKPKQKKAPAKEVFKSTLETMWKREKDNQKKLQKQMNKQRRRQLKRANEEDDKVIKKLEKKLRIDKSKSSKLVPSIFNDGLDYALELCLPDDAEEKLPSKTKQKPQEIDESDDDFGLGVDSEDDGDIFDESEDGGSEMDDSDSGDINEQDDNNLSAESDNEEELKPPPAPKTDIYGRVLDDSGNIIEESKGKYIPPHLRNQMNQDSEKVLKLKRQLKGHINRLAEANLPKVAKEIDRLYMENARNDMNNTLSSLILDALVTNVLSSERSVLEHLLLLATLHANVGSEVGAHFLERVADKFNNTLASNKNVEDKTLDNLVFIFCHLYTYKIIQENLIYEIINKLIAIVDEKSIECILIVLRSIGFTLRKDNPLALKDLIATLQKLANDSLQETDNNSRLKYMLDVLLAIKNNNMKKIPQYDPSVSEHLKKQLKALCVNGKYVTTLNIQLTDLLNAEARGKWWIIGSAWTGSAADGKNSSTTEDASGMMAPGDPSFSSQLLELAKIQRMNTDEKKSIFCVLMSAEDYIDAFEKLMHLSVKDNNILISIIIHCCLSEKVYNPYYGILTQKFCDYDRKYQLAAKFACWDKIRNFTAMSSKQLKNFATFMTHLIQHGGLAISVLKVIEFSELDNCSLQFMRYIMVALLLCKEEEFLQIFQRISPSMKLNAFKDSVRLFMQHFLLKNIKKNNISDEDNVLLAKRVQMADELLSYSRSFNC